MANEKRSVPVGLHKLATVALFTVGNTLIRFPWRGENGELPVLALCSLLVSCVPALALYPLLRRLLRTKLSGHPARHLLAGTVALALAGYAAYTAFVCLRTYLDFVDATVLPTGGRWLLLPSFLVCTVWLACVGDRGTDVFALVALATTLLCTVGLFLFGIPEYRLEVLPMEARLGEGNLLQPLLTLGLEIALPLVLLSAYFALTLPQNGARTLLLGSLVGSGVLLICILQTLLTLGSGLAAFYPYPYAYAVRMISVGPYFFRLEGFSYLPDFLACLFRSALCLATARRLCGRFLPRVAHRVPVAMGVALFVALNVAKLLA